VPQVVLRRTPALRRPFHINQGEVAVALVRVSKGVFIRTECVGKVVQTQYVEAFVRKTQTDVYDVTGQHILFSKCTLVATSAEPHETEEVLRDNQAHDEVREALRQERDAVPYKPNA
jgi:hypothetical protein